MEPFGDAILAAFGLKVDKLLGFHGICDGASMLGGGADLALDPADTAIGALVRSDGLISASRPNG